MHLITTVKELLNKHVSILTVKVQKYTVHIIIIESVDSISMDDPDVTYT